MITCTGKYKSSVVNGMGATADKPLGDSPETDLGLAHNEAWRVAATNLYQRLTDKFKKTQEKASIPDDIKEFVSITANKYCKSANNVCVQQTLLNDTISSIQSRADNFKASSKIIEWMLQAACALEFLDSLTPASEHSLTPQQKSNGISPIIIIGAILGAYFLLRK